ncbi:MAG: PAS domain-containing protein [Haloferacaceae archaeon]
MSRTGQGAERGQSPASLVLTMHPGQDRKLLEDWLSTFAEYRVRVASGPPAASEYGLCLIDRATWRDHEERLRDRKAAADPVFLPHVLLVTGEAEEWSAVDDVISLPVERAVLHRRIENLLGARRASLRLREREEQYERLVELAPEGILIVTDGRIRYANRAAVDLLGAGDADALIGRSRHEHVEGEDRITVEVVDCERTIPAADLAVLSGDTETATEHPQGVGAWLLRWVTLDAGAITVDTDGPPTIRLRFRPAEGREPGDATG